MKFRAFPMDHIESNFNNTIVHNIAIIIIVTNEVNNMCVIRNNIAELLEISKIGATTSNQYNII